MQYVNKRYADSIDYKVKEIMSWEPSEFLKAIHPEDRNIVRRHAELRQKGLKDEINHYIHRGIKKSGEIAWFEVFANTIIYRGRSADLAISLDITEQKKVEEERKLAQKELEKSYEKLKELEKIIKSSPGIVFLWQNSEGWPVEFVSENVKQFGYTQEDFYSGKIIYEEMVHPDDLERVAEEVNIYSNEDISEFVQEYRI